MLLRIVFLVISVTVFVAANHIPKIVGKPRPCELNDYTCIRNNLAVNSKCRNVRKGNIAKYTVPRQRFETPHFNASYIDYDLVVSGQDKCYVSEFFFDMKLDSGVLGIDCPNLNFVSNRVLLQHWRLQEDSVFRYRINSTYPLTSLTLNFNRADELNLCNVFTFAYVDQLPQFNISPFDIQTQEFLSTDLSLLNIFERETFFYRGNMLARKFINNFLCDFGCD